jgi:hypothetical protein
MHAELLVAEAPARDVDRDPEPLLAVKLDDDAVAALLDDRVLDEPLGALDEHGRLLAVHRLDDDVAGRDLDLELDGLGRVEAVLCHRQLSWCTTRSGRRIGVRGARTGGR